MTYLSSHQRVIQRQRGFTMVELMVALLIGLFLMGGLMTLLQNNRKAFSSQSLLGQLQDSERLAMTMMSGVIQQSGYFPDPTLNSPATLPAVGTFAAGQGLTGSTTAGSDTIIARYATAPGDGILNCSGTSNPATSGANATYSNAFSIAVNGGVSQLVCTDQSGNVYPLVNGVTKLQVLYGVSTSATNTTNVDTYMTAAQVTNWNNVISAKITLTFVNPMYGNLPGQTTLASTLATIDFTRIIPVMSNTGIAT